jgi:hypothetical protein
MTGSAGKTNSLSTVWTDVTENSVVAAGGYGMGVAVGDYDAAG